jgi:hypothetical protein
MNPLSDTHFEERCLVAIRVDEDELVKLKGRFLVEDLWVIDR